MPWTEAVFLLLAATTTQIRPSACSGGAEDAQRLLKTLFTDREYNPVVRPALNYSHPTRVSLELSLDALLGLDIKNQVMSIHGFMRMRWKDDLLTWNESEYSGMKYLILPQDRIWRPDIVFYNTVSEDMYLGSESTQITVTADGSVRWEPMFVLHSSCEVDISKYPFDVNVCPIKIHSWMSDNRTVLMEFADNPINTTFLMPNGIFEVIPAGTHTVDFGFIYDKSVFYQQMIFDVQLKRRPAYLGLSLLMPVALLAVMSTVSFLLPPDHGDKLNLSITVLLAFTVFLGVIDNNLPETSDGLALLVIYITIMLVHSFFGVIGNALILLMYRREQNNMRSLLISDDTASTTQDQYTSKKNGDHRPSCVDSDQRESLKMTARVIPDGGLKFKSGKNSYSFVSWFNDGWLRNLSKSKATTVNRVLFIINTLFVVIFTAVIWGKIMT